MFSGRDRVGDLHGRDGTPDHHRARPPDSREEVLAEKDRFVQRNAGSFTKMATTPWSLHGALRRVRDGSEVEPLPPRSPPAGNYL